jgi:hypothetical protein
MRADGYLLTRRATLVAMPLMAVTLGLVLLIPELPLRRTVREVPA